ncbi:YciI family protein [Paracoccus sp. (in: a-proteobacteria)]
MAGPLVEEGEMRGSLLIVEAEGLTQVKEWAAQDPYKAADLFASVEVIEWKKVIG